MHLKNQILGQRGIPILPEVLDRQVVVDDHLLTCVPRLRLGPNHLLRLLARCGCTFHSTRCNRLLGDRTEQKRASSLLKNLVCGKKLDIRLMKQTLHLIRHRQREGPASKLQRAALSGELDCRPEVVSVDPIRNFVFDPVPVQIPSVDLFYGPPASRVEEKGQDRIIKWLYCRRLFHHEMTVPWNDAEIKENRGNSLKISPIFPLPAIRRGGTSTWRRQNRPCCAWRHGQCMSTPSLDD